MVCGGRERRGNSRGRCLGKGTGIALFVLGGGSNLLVSDDGFDGLVLRVGLRGMEAEGRTRGIDYRVAAGEDWNAFVDRAVQDGCADVECLAGIPGTAGGTPVQNVGAYGQEVASSLSASAPSTWRSAPLWSSPPPECGFGYRRSRFNSQRSRTLHCDPRGVPGYSRWRAYAAVLRICNGHSGGQEGGNPPWPRSQPPCAGCGNRRECCCRRRPRLPERRQLFQEPSGERKNQAAGDCKSRREKSRRAFHRPGSALRAR